MIDLEKGCVRYNHQGEIGKVCNIEWRGKNWCRLVVDTGYGYKVIMSRGCYLNRYPLTESPTE